MGNQAVLCREFRGLNSGQPDGLPPSRVFWRFLGLCNFRVAAISHHAPVRKALAAPRLTSFVDRMDLTGWILGSLLFGMGMVFGERLFRAPLLFIFVPLFIALLIVGVYLRRTKNVQSSTTAPGPGISFRSDLIDDPAK
jgi:hypothetical protein